MFADFSDFRAISHSMLIEVQAPMPVPRAESDQFSVVNVSTPNSIVELGRLELRSPVWDVTLLNLAAIRPRSNP
jgi:hypothetical protein